MLVLVPAGVRPPIPPGIARVAILGTLMGHRWTQVFYLQVSGSAITINDLESLSDEIATLWNTDVAVEVPSVVVLTNVSIVYIPSVGEELTYEGAYSHAGSAAGTIVSDASACYVMNWKISSYYRGGHPRSYMPGVNTASISNGSDVSAGTQTSLAAAWNSFRNSLNAYTTTNITALTMGTLSFQTANAWRVTPLFRAFTSVTARAKLGSQRRRILS